MNEERERMLMSIINGTFPYYFTNKHTQEGSILDIGCGDKKLSNSLDNKNVTTLDAFSKFKPDILWDLNTQPLPIEDNSYDTVLAIDLIEHLDKVSGVRLIKEFKRIAKKRIILLTPLWWTENAENVTNKKSAYFKNTYNHHKIGRAHV